MFAQDRKAASTPRPATAKSEDEKSRTLESYIKGGFVLIADDLTNMRRTVKGILRRLGADRVVEASNGEEALKRLHSGDVRERYGECKLAILDWNMPVMTGIQAAREIRSDKNYEDLPIMMLTAEIDRDQIVEAAEIPVNGYLMKPFTVKTVEEKIITIFRNRANPPDYVKLIHEGQKLLHENRHEEALKYFETSRKMKDSARISVHIGNAYRQLGRDNDAEKEYESAIEKNPNYLKAHVTAAEFHTSRGDSDKALRFLESATKISPRDPNRQATIGRIYLEKGDTQKAQAAFNAAVEIDPRKGKEIAEDYLKKGDAAGAEEFFKKTLAKDQTDVFAMNRLGISYRRQGKWQDAVDIFTRAIKLTPRDEVIYFNLAKAYGEGGQKRQAEEVLKKALKIRPDFEEARRELEKYTPPPARG